MSYLSSPGFQDEEAACAFVEARVWAGGCVCPHCREQHLHRSLAEYDFRYNNRIANGVDDKARADNLLCGIVGERLTYQTARSGR